MSRSIPPVPVAIGFPSVVLLVAHYGFGLQTSGLALAWIGLALAIAFAIGEMAIDYWAKKNLVIIDIKRNLIEIAGEHFPFDFSTAQHFVKSKSELEASIDYAVRETLFIKQSAAIRRDVLARVWDEGTAISGLELECLREVLESTFWRVTIQHAHFND